MKLQIHILVVLLLSFVCRMEAQVPVIKLPGPLPEKDSSQFNKPIPDLKKVSDSLLHLVPDIKNNASVKSPLFSHDSLPLPPSPSFSVAKNTFNTQKAAGDSILKNKLKALKKNKLSVKGTVSNQFDYGAIPYYMASHSLPNSLYRATGNLKVRYAKLPLLVDYYYASPKFISGLNNYINIKLDVSELKEMTNNEYLKKAAAMRQRIDSLALLKEKLNRQLYATEQFKLSKMNGAALPPMPGGMPQLPTDSLRQNLNDSLKKLAGTAALPTGSMNLAQGVDTSSAKIAELKENIKHLEQLSNQLKKNADMVEYPNPDKDASKVFGEPGLQKMLGGFKKLEIGMCYPGYSTFMINQVAVKGLNTGYAARRFFINVTAGKTVVNYSVQTVNNPILNQIQNINSLFNWNTNTNEKKIIAGKLGIGKESKNYLGIGALYGKGSVSPGSTDIKSNYVFELDGRYVYKFLNFEGAVARSVLSGSAPTPLQRESAGVLQQNLYNNSYQGKISGSVPGIKTKISQSYRLVEPNFKSFGLGFMRSDIRRLESKLEQPIGTKLKLGVTYRRDEDNIRGLQYYKTILENIGYSAKIKLLKKRMDVNLSYTDVIQDLRDYATGQRKRIYSSIRTAVITYVPKFRKLNSTNTLLINQFNLRDQTQTSAIWNYSFNSMNQYKKWMVNWLNSYNESTLKDSLNFSNALNSALELNYSFNDKFKVTGGAKAAYSLKTGKAEYGYIVGFSGSFHPLFQLELRAEKLVLGDYINTLNYSNISRFPYYGYVKVVSSF